MTMTSIRKKILIVDDAADNIAMLRQALLPDYKIYFALNGPDALHLVASSNKPDLILLDILMPDMDGFEVCKQLKSVKEFQEIPVIFITAKSDASVEAKGLELGAVDFITKPFNPPVVKARVQTHLNLIHTFEQLKDRESHLRSILESALDAIITTDQNGHVVDFNPFAEKLFGYSKAQVMGKDISDFIVPVALRGAHRLKIKQVAQRILINNDFSFKQRMEVTGLCANGTHVDIDMALVATLRQNKPFFTAFLHDITERNHLLNSLNETLKSAEEANRAKSDFLANMSHEIRTPMNAILGLTRLALKCELSVKVEDYLTKVEHASQSMLAIINDILEFSRIEAGQMRLNLVEFELQGVFDHLGDLFRRQLLEKKIDLIFSISAPFPRLYGDSMRLQQVLSNLIGNALKFTEQGEIVVEARLLSTDGHRVQLEFSVQDSGIGIDPKRLPDLFESFVQADGSITRKYGGTGLGLAICKRIVALMGGSIGAQSKLGIGSIFRFNVALETRSNSLETSLQLPEYIRHNKVLLVDPRPKSRQVLEGILASFSLEIMAVASVMEGKAALTAACEIGTPDTLVILNFSPATEREELVKYGDLFHAGFAKIPKAILLTHSVGEDKKRIGKGGVIQACIEKPVNRSLLFNTILEVYGFALVKNVAHTQQESMEEQKIRESMGGRRILVVEDNPINQQVVREILERVGLVIEEAENGKIALRMLQTHTYHAVLMDLQMPQMDGFTATRLIRSDKRFANLPIIAMTAHAMEEDRKKCLAHGMNGHVGKPFDPKELYKTLAQWIHWTPVEPIPIKESIQVEMASLPNDMLGFNIKEGITRMAGDAGLYKRMLLRFRSDHVQNLEEIRNALEAGNTPLAERLAHTTKSVAGQLAATRLFESAAALEAGIGHNSPAIQSLMDEFGAALQEVLTSLALLPSEKPKPVAISAKKVVLDLAKITPVLNKLMVALTEQDSQADTLLVPLREQSQGNEMDKYIENIEKILKKYDYVQAKEILMEMIKKLEITL
ncbi:MAG: response regulator [Magnetococcus sp. DMHC-6]